SAGYELSSVVEKGNGEQHGSNAAKGGTINQDRRQAQGQQGQERQQSLPIYGTESRSATTRQHLVARAFVIFAVHPGDRHEMRKLPEEKHGVEDPRLEVEPDGGGSPADQGRHSARKCAGY